MQVVGPDRGVHPPVAHLPAETGVEVGQVGQLVVVGDQVEELFLTLGIPGVASTIGDNGPGLGRHEAAGCLGRWEVVLDEDVAADHGGRVGQDRGQAGALDPVERVDATQVENGRAQIER